MKFVVGMGAALALALTSGAAMSAPALQEFAKLPAIEMVELSPDGSKLAYVGAVNGARSVVVLQVGGDVLAATPLKDQSAELLQWAGSEVLLLRTQRSIKGVNGIGIPMPTGSWLFEPRAVEEVTAIDVKHRTSVSLIETKALRFMPPSGAIVVHEVAGRWCAFLLGRANVDAAQMSRYPLELYKIDLETGEAVKVSDAPRQAPTFVLGPEGSVVVWGGFESPGSFTPTSRIWSLRPAAGGKPLFSNNDGDNLLQVFGYGRTMDTFVVGPDRQNPDGFRLVKADGTGSEPLQDQPHVSRLWFDPKTHTLIGYTAGGDQMRVTLFDPRLKSRMEAAYKAFPGYSTLLVSASDDFGRMVVETTGADDPGTFWLVDMSTGKAKSLGTSAPIEGNQFAPVRMFDYVAGDGLAMHGVLTVPLGSSGKNLPVVVMPTAVNAQRAYPVFDWLAQAFASRGYAVFQPNPRGVMGYGKALHDAGHAELGRKMLSDVSEGIDALAAAGVIDPARVCVLGADMGGHSALMLVTKVKLKARCAVAFAAPTDLTNTLIETYWQDMMVKRKTGTAANDRSNLESVSPNSFRTFATAPILLIHPKDDLDVPVKQSEFLAEGLKKSGKAVELLEIDGSDHRLVDPATRASALKASVAFVEKYNPAN